MSNTESIIVGQTKTSSWRKSDTTWTLGLFGTAIGAGVLFFPIRAGFGGLIPILLMLVLAFPIAFYCHRALARLCLSGSNVSGNITETVEEHFGKTGGVVITFLYFFAICPLLWIYGVTITNTFMTFWENQLQMPALNRGVVALFLLLLMAFVIWFGKDLMVKVMSYLVFPFIASLVLISLSLIPYWNSAVIDQVNLSDIAFTGHDGILVTVWLGISIMVFSFNFSPIVSSFVVSKREEYEPEFGKEFTEQKCSKIIGRASLLMVAVVMFFAFSCLFTLSPQNMADAKAQNIPVLSYLANHFASMSGTKSTFATLLEYGASIIALKGGAVQPKTEDELCGVKVGLQAGTTWVTSLKKHSDEWCLKNGKPAITIQEFPTAPEASQALLSKNIGAPAAQIIVDKSRGRLGISSTRLVYPLPLGIYVAKGNTELAEAIKATLATLKANGQYAALIKKYNLESID